MTARLDSGFNPLENMLLNVGRFLLIALPVIQAFHKFLNYSGNVDYFTRLGLPAPEALVVLTIVLGAIVALMLLFGFVFRFAVVLIALFCLGDAIFAQVLDQGLGTELHRYYFGLDMIIVGGCLAFLVTGPGDWSVSGRFNRRR